MRCQILILVLFCVLAPDMLQGDVADSAANGFTLKITTVVHAGPSDVYNRLVHNIGDWWSSEHTFSSDAHNLSIEERPMGCFCEKLPNGGGVRHAEVVLIMPNRMLVMSGAFGPLQRFGAAATLSFVLTPLQQDTKLEVIYAVGGYLPEGLNTWAALVDKVLTEQMTRLKDYLETGSADAAEGAKKPL
jgi:hypothetical protein